MGRPCERTPIPPRRRTDEGARRPGRSRRSRAEVRVVRDLQRPLPRPLGQPAFRVGLHPPRDPADQELLVVRPRLLAEDHGVLQPQFAHGHPPQFAHLLADVQQPPRGPGGTAGSVRGDVGGGLQTARPGWFRTGPSNTPRATLLLNSRGASTRERESSRGLLPVGREQPWGLPSDPEIRLQDRERGGRAGKRRNPHPHGTFRDLGGGPPEGPTRKPKRRRVSAAASVTPYPQPARTDSRPLQRSSLHLLSVDARRSPLARIKRPHGPYMLLPFLGIPLKMGIAGKPSLFPLWTMHAP